MELVIQENEFSVTKSMHPSQMQPLLYSCKQTPYKWCPNMQVSQLHSLICMLDLAICRICPEAVLAPVSPSAVHTRWFCAAIVVWISRYLSHMRKCQ